MFLAEPSTPAEVRTRFFSRRVLSALSTVALLIIWPYDLSFALDVNRLKHLLGYSHRVDTILRVNCNLGKIRQVKQIFVSEGQNIPLKFLEFFNLPKLTVNLLDTQSIKSLCKECQIIQFFVTSTNLDYFY